MPRVADVPERVIEVEVRVDRREDRTVRQLARRLDLEVRAGRLKVPFDHEDGVAADDDPAVRQTFLTLGRIRKGGVDAVGHPRDAAERPVEHDARALVPRRRLPDAQDRRDHRREQELPSIEVHMCLPPLEETRLLLR